MEEFRSILKSLMRLGIFLVLLGPGAGCTTPPQSSVEPDPEVLGRLQTVIDSFYAGGSFPGVSASVSMPDGSLLNVVAGEADTVRHIPMASSSRMLQGSVGKTYFAALALQLMGEDRLGLDDPVSQFLGHIPWYSRVPNAGEITVRHLMTHTSGVMRYEFKEAFTDDLTAQPDKVWKP